MDKRSSLSKPYGPDLLRLAARGPAVAVFSGVSQPAPGVQPRKLDHARETLTRGSGGHPAPFHPVGPPSRIHAIPLWDNKIRWFAEDAASGDRRRFGALEPRGDVSLHSPFAGGSQTRHFPGRKGRPRGQRGHDLSVHTLWIDVWIGAEAATTASGGLWNPKRTPSVSGTTSVNFSSKR